MRHSLSMIFEGLPEIQEVADRERASSLTHRDKIDMPSRGIPPQEVVKPQAEDSSKANGSQFDHEVGFKVI
jgi:hypothetical protein